jgi:hypothetical protein
MLVEFVQLVNAIARVNSLPMGQDLVVPQKPPRPFVPPLLKSEQPVGELNVEAVLIAAPAAVGKSTVANALSFERQAPLLDLARVPVGAGSLRGLLAAAYGPDAIEAFHRGDLPIIVDAVDEGRLHSGLQGLPAFFRTAGELMSEARGSRNRVKLVILSRPDALRWARDELHSACPDLTRAELTIDFFDEQGARAMIEVYADFYAQEHAPYWEHRDRALQVRDGYFDAIARVLGVRPGELWTMPDARAFAGYAPVLAALGEMLPRIEHFERLENRLRSTAGTGEAWAVLEEVLDEVLVREQGKLVNALRGRVKSHVPAVAYDRGEQLRLLAAFIDGGQPTPKVLGLPPGEEQIYQQMVQERLPEHAFLREAKPANAVFASFILAEAIDAGRGFGTAAAQILRDVSREPFLWRSLERRLRADSLLDGAYAGCVLNSLWNEPDPKDVQTTVLPADGGGARVILILSPTKRIEFNATLPLVLFEQARAFTAELGEDATVELEGRAGRNGGPAWFTLRGPVTLICGTLTIGADVIQLEDRIWLQANNAVPTRGVPTLVAGTNMRIGLEGALVRMYPWNQLRRTIASPDEGAAPLSAFERLIQLCDERIGSIPVHLYPDYTIPDGPLSWLRRQFGEIFPRLVDLMIREGIAQKGEREKGVRGAVPMVVVRFGQAFSEIRAALRGDDVRPEVRGFVEKVRKDVL